MPPKFPGIPCAFALLSDPAETSTHGIARFGSAAANSEGNGSRMGTFRGSIAPLSHFLSTLREAGRPEAHARLGSRRSPTLPAGILTRWDALQGFRLLTHFSILLVRASSAYRSSKRLGLVERPLGAPESVTVAESVTVTETEAETEAGAEAGTVALAAANRKRQRQRTAPSPGHRAGSSPPSRETPETPCGACSVPRRARRRVRSRRRRGRGRRG